MALLPTLDFGKFLHGTQTERQELADQLVASFTQHGFVKLINHGVPDEVVDGIWKWVCYFETSEIDEEMAKCNIVGQRILLFDC